MGIGERYHAPLHNTLRKRELEYPNVNSCLLLSMSVLAMSIALGPESIVPSVLGFGELSSLRTHNEAPIPKG